MTSRRLVLGHNAGVVHTFTAVKTHVVCVLSGNPESQKEKGDGHEVPRLTGGVW